MRIHVNVVFFVVLSSVSFSIMFRAVYGQYVTEYKIHVEDDGSASWSIQQTGTYIQVTPDTLIEFRRKVLSLVETCENFTQRTMTVPENSISIIENVSGSYIAVEYRFEWKNFSRIDGISIKIGDVFEVEDFFVRLYGDGKIFLNYPSEYTVETVLPEPSERNDSNQLLVWWGTSDF